LLKVHAAQSSLSVIERDIALDKAFGQAMFGKLACAERARKKAAFIIVALGLYQPSAFQAGLDKVQNNLQGFQCLATIMQLQAFFKFDCSAKPTLRVIFVEPAAVG
jgi:hypothetical protein